MINSKEQREKQKNKAVELREAGNHKEALNILEEIISWDRQNDNAKGLVDVLGHKKITLQLMSDKAEAEEEKEALLEKVEEVAKEALDLAIKNFGEKDGAVAIQKVHMGSLLNKLGKYEEAKKHLEEALENLEGSEAHKAWPLGIKAAVEHTLGSEKDALGTLQMAQEKLFEGYDEEVTGDDQAEIKLRVWNSGIMLGFAKVYADTGKKLLAEVYASAVIETPDPDNILVGRKEEAKIILKSLK